MCGGELDLPEGVLAGQCPYCGTLTTFPKLSSDELANLYNRAEHFRRNNEYDKAVSAYEKIVEANPDDAEAYWGIVISKFGIEYVEDPVSHERIPTCHRVHYESILADQNFLTALEKAGNSEKALYEAEAKRIAEIQKGILAISNNEKPFDVFICYKESDNYGRRTKDSVTAQEIYYQLTNAGYKVFFARITLESKLGQQYEPYIFAALNSAKVMLVIGSEKDYFDAVWVRNEWSRFLSLMKNDKSRLLIPCYKDMDAYDIPEALSLFQAQDMGKIGFIQDLLHGIKKVMDKTAPAAAAAPAAPVVSGDVKSKDHPFLRRAKLFLRSGDFVSAKEYCEKILDAEPENGWAYFYRLMAENNVSNEEQLSGIAGIEQQQSWSLAKEFADNELAETLERITQEARRKAEEARRKAEEARRKAEEARRKAAEEEQRLFEEDRRLSSGADTRYAILRDYLFAEKELNADANVIRKIEQCMADERHLLDSSELLTGKMVAPVQAKSEALISSLPAIETLQSAILGRRRKRFFMVGIISVIIIAVSLYFLRHYIRGYELSEDGTVLVDITREGITEFTIPDSVTTIGDWAFHNCSSLTSVTIPDSVTTIENCAFNGCSSLTSITIPDSVTSIGYCAFRDCSSLTSVTIPDSVTTIGDSTFFGCSSLTSVTIPNSVTSIGAYTFFDCSSLTNITIPDSVASIGEGAFKYCSNLTSVTIPNRVTSIDADTFYGCSSLTSVTIPESVTKIGWKAFYNCSSLTRVSIPRNCKVGYKAFPDGCKVIRR